MQFGCQAYRGKPPTAAKAAICHRIEPTFPTGATSASSGVKVTSFPFCRIPIPLLPECFLKHGRGIGLFVAILHDDRGVERQLMLFGKRTGRLPATGDDYSARRDGQRMVWSASINFISDEVVHGGSGSQNNSG